MSAPAFDVRGVSYLYNRTPALDSLSLGVFAGERLALLGANGSGKSTLLRVLAGLSFPSQGAVSFFGEDLTEARLQHEEFFFRFRRRAGIVFQNPDIQLFNPSVFDELAFGPLQLGLSKAEVRRRVEETLERFHLAHLRDRAPHRLSGGEKKRVALASVLILDPDVLLLDEPAAALDPASQSLILDLYSAWAGGAKTVVTATHDLDSLEEIADRCLVLENGRLAAEGAPLVILHDVALLERTRLIRPHRHVHEAGAVQPHPHIHRH